MGMKGSARPMGLKANFLFSASQILRSWLSLETKGAISASSSLPSSAGATAVSFGAA
jgi:hypothetical protein